MCEVCVCVCVCMHAGYCTSSVSPVLIQLDVLTAQFSSHSSAADLEWEDATHERLQQLQLTKEQLSERAQQVVKGS